MAGKKKPEKNSGNGEAKTPKTFSAEMVSVEDLHPHPRNYRAHPDDQLEHIIASIQQHGFYRNVVVARDNTILAGHGVVEASRKMGLASIPVLRLDLDPNEPRALKVLTGDNEIGNLIEIHDRDLSLLLKEIRDTDGLLGTGYDDMMLANLLMVTRTAGEINSFDAAAEWVGMPEHDPGVPHIFVQIQFMTQEDKRAFYEHLGIAETNVKHFAKHDSMWWPLREDHDRSSVRLEERES